MRGKRKAKRWERNLTFVADAGFRGHVTDLSAIGMRLRIQGDAKVDMSAKPIAGTLSFESGSHTRIKVKVVRVVKQKGSLELGLEIAEADRGFFEALPTME